MEGDHKRHLREWDERRALSHHLAHLIAFAHHDPKKMPQFEASDKPKVEDPEIGNAKFREYMRGLARRDAKRAGA